MSCVHGGICNNYRLFQSLSVNSMPITECALIECCNLSATSHKAMHLVSNEHGFYVTKMCFSSNRVPVKISKIGCKSVLMPFYIMNDLSERISFVHAPQQNAY